MIGQSFRVLFRNFVAFMILCGLVTTPSIALNLYQWSQAMEGDPDLLLSLAQLPLSLLDFVATAAISYGVFQQLRNRPASIVECLVVGVRRMLPVLGVALLTFLVVFGGLLLF